MDNPLRLPSPHPASLALDELRKQCETRRTRRSGPGGQHRNKVETAIVLRHLPTGVEAEASERRSQTQNAEAAIQRLRIRLAVEVRTPATPPTLLWKRRATSGTMRVNPDHEDFPSLLAEALDQLADTDWDDRLAADALGVNRSSFIRLLRSEPRALSHLNEHRKAQGLRPLA